MFAWPLTILGLLIVFIAFTVVSWISAFAVGVKRLHDRDKSGWLDPFVLSRAVDSRQHREHIRAGRWSRSCSGSPLSSSRSGASWSLVSCAGPSAPTRMDPIRCNGPPLSTLLLRQHLPVLDLLRSGEVSLGAWAAAVRAGSWTILRKIDYASQDCASARMYPALAPDAGRAVHLEPEPGRAAADRSIVWPVVRRKPDIDDGFQCLEKYTAQGQSKCFQGPRRHSPLCWCSGNLPWPPATTGSRITGGPCVTRRRRPPLRGLTRHQPRRQAVYGRGKGLVRPCEPGLLKTLPVLKLIRRGTLRPRSVHTRRPSRTS